MNDKEKLIGMKKAIRQVINYPTKKQGRRTEDGYPLEFSYDEFAYKRMIDSIRDALKEIIKDFG